MAILHPIFANKVDTSAHLNTMSWDKEIGIDPFSSICILGSLMLLGLVLHIIAKIVIDHIKSESKSGAKSYKASSKKRVLLSNYNFKFHQKITKFFVYLSFLNTASASSAACDAFRACGSTCGKSVLDGPCDEDSDCARTATWDDAGYNKEYCTEYDSHTRNPTTDKESCRNICLAEPGCNAFAVGRDCVWYQGCVKSNVDQPSNWEFTYGFLVSSSQTATWDDAGYNKEYCTDYDSYTRNPTTDKESCRNMCLAELGCNAFAVGRDCVWYQGCVKSNVDQPNWGFTYGFLVSSSQGVYCLGQTAQSCGECKVIPVPVPAPAPAPVPVPVPVPAPVPVPIPVPFPKLPGRPTQARPPLPPL